MSPFTEDCLNHALSIILMLLITLILLVIPGHTHPIRHIHPTSMLVIPILLVLFIISILPFILAIDFLLVILILPSILIILILFVIAIRCLTHRQNNYTQWIFHMGKFMAVLIRPLFRLTLSVIKQLHVLMTLMKRIVYHLKVWMHLHIF